MNNRARAGARCQGGKNMATDGCARRRRRVLCGAIVAVGLLGAGCGATPDSSASENTPMLAQERKVAKPGGRLIVAIPAETNGWNPFIDQWTDSGTLVGTSMIEPLAVQDNDGRGQPWLAEKWEPRADFKEWTIGLRPGVFFHDGTPMDAPAVKKSLDASFLSGLYQVALGPLYDHVEVVDPLTVRVF